VIFVIFLISSIPVRAESPKEIEFFETKIRPVLIKHCYECHSAESDAIKGGLRLDIAAGILKGGDSGPSLVAKKPAESLLLESLQYDSLEMPPAGKLPAAVIRDFETWIKMGAPDPRKDAPSGPSPLVQQIDFEKAREFWAFQPVEEQPLPKTSDSDWPANWMDHFILSALEEKGLSPSEDADRATLIRRIAMDVTGLPPSVEEMEELLSSDKPDAIERYVDRLLSSQQYSEHWARHWLDVARYADSNGGDFNATFHDAWRYRNYVVETYNDDRPIDQFIIEQIAGDLLPAESDDVRSRQLIATGFLMMGAKMLSERDKEKLRMDVVDEQISVIGSTFMGMTMGCARCHDHKFDPIPTEDYYALAGIFKSTQTLDGESQKYVSTWTKEPLPISKEHAASIQEYNTQSSNFKAKIKATKDELKKLKKQISGSSELSLGTVLDDDKATLLGEWKTSSLSKNRVGPQYIHDNRTNKGECSATFKWPVSKSGEYEVRFAFAGTGGRSTAVPVSIKHADGETTIQVDQTKVAPIEETLLPLGRFHFKKDAEAVVTISNAGTTGFVLVDAVQFVLVSELETKSTAVNPELLAKQTDLEKQLAQAELDLKRLEKAKPAPAPLAFAVREEKTPSDCQLCIRGEHQNLGPMVPRGLITVAMYDDPPAFEETSSGRLNLAKWIANDRHPLTARVYVNRVWHHLLGHGIVRSVDNFGHLGERPTHPELLDQLAYQFMQHNWSTKWLVREIILSRTYQQSSHRDESKWSADPENRLLWRANRKRLSAEQLRDSMLHATEEIDLDSAESPVGGLGTLVTQNKPNDGGYKTPSTNGRTIYAPVIRNELPSIMRVFDFANPDFVTGQRPATNVPAQALWMLNGPFVQERSQRLATLVLKAESQPPERIITLYQRVLGRPPTRSEEALATEFITGANAQELTAEQEQQLWADLAHALFASSAFRMLD